MRELCEAKVAIDIIGERRGQGWKCGERNRGQSTLQFVRDIRCKTGPLLMG
jgi:hypothetical protein